MPPKAPDRPNGKSITDFFKRAPSVSHTWNHLDNDSDDELPVSTADAALPTTKQSNSSMLPTTEIQSPANGKLNPPSSVSSSLAFRVSPQTQRIIKLPEDEDIPKQPNLQKSGRDSKLVFESIQSSVSPLSSMRDVPSSTSLQSQPRSSGKRVNIQGQEVVRGSDEDSDDSLEDLDELFARQKPNAQSFKKPLGAASSEKSRASTKMVTKSVDVKATAREKMLKLRQSIQAEQEKQERMAELTRKLQEKSSAVELSGPVTLELTADLIKATAVTNGDVDEEQIKKTMNAVKRIEALQQEIVWQFFKPEIPELPMAAFPSKTLSKEPWMLPLKGQDKRDAAFKSGYIKRLARRLALPVEVQHWMFNEICADYESVDLVMAYISTVESACERFTNHLKPDKLRELFAAVGAKEVAIDLGKVEEELQITDSPPRSFSPNVRWLIELLRRLSPTMHKDTAKLAIQVLVRLAIDYSVAKDTSLRLLIEKTLDALINSFEEHASINILQEIACTLFNSTKHQTLRSRVVEELPVSSSRAHFFRRHVALAFALEKTPNYGSTFDNLALYSHIILFLDNCKELRIRPNTDYTLVTAIIKILDVAIDEGFARPLDVSTDISQPLNADTADLAQPKGDFFKPRKQITKSAQREAEDEFNQNVDQLVLVLEKIRDRIVTTGATHISRLEARSTIERLLQRLQYAVRTRRLERKDWYGGGNGVKQSIPETGLEQDGDVVGSGRDSSAIMDVDD